MTGRTLRAPRAGQGWMSQAACGEHPDLPWTADTRDTPAEDVALMAAICGGCPVMASCWAYAAAEDITGGYWAGTDWDILARATTRTPRRSRSSRARDRGAA